MAGPIHLDPLAAPAFASFLFPAAAATTPPSAPDAGRLWLAWALALALLLIVFLCGVLLLGWARRRVTPTRRSARRGGRTKDAWAEAGRRLDPGDGSDDDTVDIDPLDGYGGGRRG